MKEKRWAQIASTIKTSIRRGELAHGARIASETEMASRWNVSQVTVHRALSELQREGWVVRRPGAGTVVADPSSIPMAKIAVIAETISDPPQCDYIRGISEYLTGKFDLTPMNANRSSIIEAKCLEEAAAECSAVISVPMCDPHNTALYNRIAAIMPLIFIDCTQDGVDADAFMTDNFESMLMGLKHMYSLGHRRIAYLMENTLNFSAVRDRSAAYRHFMKETVGISAPERWERQFPGNVMTAEQYVGAVENALAEMMLSDEPITAVACQHDALLQVLIECCMHLGLRIPDDLGVLSFNDAPRRVPNGGVHRLVQRSVEMGHMAALRVQQRLTTTPPGAPPQITKVITDLYPAVTYAFSAASSELARRQTMRLAG